jgi:alpha-mannosidase
MPDLKQRPVVHLFSQAHIDPIWMWLWEEGAREAISTFRTAADLLDEFPEFVFNHNESLLYEWIEEYDPPLFERIRAFVKAGRWNITGGWYLQPDVNLLGGETLVRVILEGRRYFAEKFGVRPTVSYNFDSFGHPASLPQLLKQSGFEMYIHCRPTGQQMELPAPFYCWRGVDGTEVITVRPDTGWYCTPLEGQAEMQLRAGVHVAKQTGRDTIVTWGLGDHGGGATRADLLRFREVIAEINREEEVEVRHSTPENFLRSIQQWDTNLPTQEGELQRTLSGTYTSVAPIKRQMREGEAMLASAERWAAIAWWRYGWPYPAEMLREAWKRLMLNTFHDVLCGSLIDTALPGVNDAYGYAHDVARRIIVKHQNAMLPNVKPTADTIPFYVLNPHSSPMKAHVGCNFLAAYAPPRERRVFALFDEDGNEVPCQPSGGNTVLAGGNSIVGQGVWQPFIGMVAEVPPLTARRYEIRFQPPTARPENPLTVQEDEGGITVENRWFKARFSRAEAALVELVDKASGRNLLSGAAQMTVNYDYAHGWGGESNYVYNKLLSPMNALIPAEVGDFTGMEGQTGPALRIIAQGNISVTVECLVGWQHTRASLKYTLFADLPEVEIDTRLFMQARRKMIKLVIPFNLPAVRAVCEVPYGAAERPADATEWPYARWVRLESDGMAVGVANSGQNAFDLSPDGTLRLSISRGGTHSSWEEGQGLDTSQSWTYMDQEQIDTRFRIIADADAGDVAARLVPAALELNQPLERFFVYHAPSAPQGAPEQPVPFLHIEPATVILGALKKAEREDALAVRLAETIGQAVTAQVRLEGGAPQSIEFRPYEIKTFLVGKDGAWTPCNLLEETS